MDVVTQEVILKAQATPHNKVQMLILVVPEVQAEEQEVQTVLLRIIEAVTETKVIVAD
tara:strand:- start:210 stop:383 length:174 start_codon:yes stop_codon:yes gene_type:complete